jgi:hypothetical protein
MLNRYAAALGLFLGLLQGCVGEEYVDEPLEEKVGALWNNPPIAAGVAWGEAGVTALIDSTTLQFTVPTLTGSNGKFAAWTCIGGFLHGPTEPYFEAGVTGTRSNGSNSYKFFVDFLPAAWVTSSCTVRGGDVVRITTHIDLADSTPTGAASFENLTLGSTCWLFADKPAGSSQFFADSSGYAVERLSGSPLANFGAIRATWSHHTVSNLAPIQNWRPMIGQNGTTTLATASKTPGVSNSIDFYWRAPGP